MRRARRAVIALALMAPPVAASRPAWGQDLLTGTPTGWTCDAAERPTTCTGFLAGAGGVALHADLRLPEPRGRVMAPLLVVLHGLGGSKETAASQTGYAGDEFFADRGYAVLRYSARGFGMSWGFARLARLDAEIADLQALVSAVVDDPRFAVDGARVGVTGVSYGGGQAWLIASRVAWTTPGGRTVRVRAIAPVVTWSDLAASLLPNGRADSTEVVGTPKLSYFGALFAGGLRREPSRPYPNYDPSLAALAARIALGEPFEAAGTRDPVAGAGLRDLTDLRSVAWQRGWLGEIRDPSRQVPVLAIQGWTDDLFPAGEALRMVRLLRDADPGYPVKLYLGDIGHPRARNRGREVAAAGRLLVEWFDHWLLGRGQAPLFDVTVAEVVAVSGGGEVVRGRDLEALAGSTVSFSEPGPLALLNPAAPPSGLPADPFVALLAGRLIDPLAPTLVDTSGLPGLGAIVRRRADDLSPGGLWYLGQGRVRLRGTVVGTDAQYDVKLWDRGPDGVVHLVDRGTWKHVGPPGALTAEVPLNGSSWRFRPGHELLLEVGNVDLPALRPNNLPSSTVLDEVTVELPARGSAPSAQGVRGGAATSTSVTTPPAPPAIRAGSAAPGVNAAAPPVPEASVPPSPAETTGARKAGGSGSEPSGALTLAAGLLAVVAAAALIGLRLVR